jgi:hypothetical protein
MDRIDAAALVGIEAELDRRIVSEFGLDLSGLVRDMTNFATFIDSTNARAPIAQRGKAKQKRTDLRLVVLALVSPGTAGSRWSRTPIPGTGPTSPSSPG